MNDRKPPRHTIQGDVVSFRYRSLESLGSRAYVWDIDKTYLRTNFDTLKGLFKTAFEKSFQKVNVPGTATLIRFLQPIPIFFISASPPQMEKKIYEKMRLDRIDPHGIFLKDNLKNFRPRKFKRLKQQVGFKIQALMELRMTLPEDVQMVLFGDDSESDAVVYNLFSDICCRRLAPQEIGGVLEALHVSAEQRTFILELQKKVAINDPVEKIYINLVADTDPDYYRKFGRRTLATFTTFQAAMDLFQEGHISQEAIVATGQDMLFNYGFSAEELAQSLQDLNKRGFLKEETQGALLDALKGQGILPPNYKSNSVLESFQTPLHTLQKLGEKILGSTVAPDPWVPDHIDYLRDFR